MVLVPEAGVVVVTMASQRWRCSLFDPPRLAQSNPACHAALAVLGAPVPSRYAGRVDCSRIQRSVRRGKPETFPNRVLVGFPEMLWITATSLSHEICRGFVMKGQTNVRQTYYFTPVLVHGYIQTLLLFLRCVWSVYAYVYFHILRPLA